MTNLDRYQKLKGKADELQREADRAEGALEQLMDKLKDEFDCETLEEAEKLSKKLEKEAKKAEEDFETAIDMFEEKWGDVLDRE